MPFARASSRIAATTGRLVARAVRAAVTLAIAGFAAFALLLLAVRFVVFPQVEAYRDTLTAQLSRELGQPVELRALTTGWDGWNPKLVLHDFRVLDRMRAGAAPLLELPEVELTVAWTSLPLLELRLKQLSIDRPRLAVRRDRAGVLHVAGIELDPSQPSDDTRFTDWLLRQPRIEVRDALLIWNDDLRNAPQLVLDGVQLRLENYFGLHRIGLTGTPPAELAAPVDLRGEWHGDTLAQWRNVSGRMYARLDYADIAAWREWLPLPVPIASGKGAMRMWFEFDAGEPRNVVADLALADVRATLREGLPELALATLAGRIEWRYAPGKRDLLLRELAFATASGEKMDATDFTLTMRDASGDTPASGRIEFDRLELAPLRDLAAHLPLPDRLRTDLARFAPRGTLSNGHAQWQGAIDAPAGFDIAADFSDFGIIAQDALPGLRDLAGRLTATHTGGELKLAGHVTAVDLPRVFLEPVALETFSADVSWQRKNEQTVVRLERVDFANADAAGTASGTWRSLAQGPGEIDLTAQLSRVDPRGVHKYLPRNVSDRARAWVARALVDGSATDTRVRLAGNLSQFPFAEGKNGQLVVTGKAKGVTLDFANDWPAVGGLAGDFKLDGMRLSVDASQGSVYGATLGRTRAEIPDLRGPHRVLRIDGEASGPTADFIRYVESSPVSGWIAHATTNATASGNGALALKLELPIAGDTPAKVAGEFTFNANEIRLAGVPALDKVSGKLLFSEEDVHARDITAETLGGPARLSLASAAAAGGERSVRVNANGTANLATVKREFALPSAERLSGSADWTLALDLRGDGATWIVESPMKGAQVDLPAPLGKAASDAVPLRIERRFDPRKPNEDTLNAAYGKNVQFAAHRKLGTGSADIDRAQLVAGRAAERADAARADRAGFWVRAELPALNVDDWLSLTREHKTPGSGNSALPALAGIDLDVAALDAMGRRLTDIKVSARPAGEDWKLDLRGHEIAGSATWFAPAGDAPNGRVVARLSRLAMPGPGELHAWSGAEASADAQDGAASARWPGIDLVAEAFASRGGHDIGRLELTAFPRGSEWRVDKLALINDAGRIDANGAWRASGRNEQTKLDVAVDVKEAGTFLARFGYPDALRNAPTTIEGQLAWAGPPHAFDYPTLAGTFHVHSGAGRFTKIEPGLGKLLGVLSLQSLPRRVSLDFTDVFSEGFTFDSIDGDVRIQNGVMSTPELRLAGPSARVVIAGDTDLAHETQRLSVRVQPALSGGVSAGAALLFLANPIVGAAVGAGSLLAQKIMKDPIEQIFSYDYTVTGSWSDPVVTRGKVATALAPADVAPR